MIHTVTAPLEIKAFGDAASGEFTGYGAVFHTVDGHGDRILPGAFAASLAERKAAGRHVPMHLNHGLPELGGVRGIGVWRAMSEDEHGLRVEGKISGMSTDAGRLLFERVRDGALGGLSIGYKVAGNGATYGRNPGEPRRTIKAATLGEVSLVDDPSNAFARVDSIKSRLAAGDVPTLREIEELLRDAPFRFSRAQAASFAAGGYKSLIARESDEGEADRTEADSALADIRAALAGFSLPSLR